MEISPEISIVVIHLLVYVVVIIVLKVLGNYVIRKDLNGIKNTVICSLMLFTHDQFRIIGLKSILCRQYTYKSNNANFFHLE